MLNFFHLKNEVKDFCHFMEKKWSPLEDTASFPGVCFFLHVILVSDSSSLCLEKYLLEGNFPLQSHLKSLTFR